MASPIPFEQLPVVDRSRTRFPSAREFRDGVILPVDKPKSWTSFDVVRYVRKRIPVKKVGHAGTLDPMATGLLLLCCGRATRSVSQIQDQAKTYIAEITFGGCTPSYDAMTGITETSPWNHITEESLAEIIRRDFIGEIEQVPPAYSALWKDGQRMYKLARKGVAVEPEPRNVIVHEMKVISFKMPKVTISIRSGKGFYVRSLAYDLAKSAGSLAYLSELKRTDVGPFSVTHAWSADQFNRWCGYD